MCARVSIFFLIFFLVSRHIRLNLLFYIEILEGDELVERLNYWTECYTVGIYSKFEFCIQTLSISAFPFIISFSIKKKKKLSVHFGTKPREITKACGSCSEQCSTTSRNCTGFKLYQLYSGGLSLG